MPFVLLVAGVVLVVAAVRNTQQELFYLMARDFTGQHNFIYWFLSILIIGAVGYIPKMKPISDGFLILVILVLFLKKGTGFFDMFQKQIAATDVSSPQVQPPGATSASYTGSGGGFGVNIGTGGGGVQIGSGGVGIKLPSINIGGVTIGGPTGPQGGTPPFTNPGGGFVGF